MNGFCFGAEADCFEGGSNNGEEIDGGNSEPEFAAHNARDVEQVFDQLGLESGVAFNGSQRFLRFGFV